jgi:uncharacterized repeat protein (TIGR01451 family)
VTATQTASRSTTPTLPREMVADLAIAIDDGLTTIRRGRGLTYVITVTNLGPADVMGAVVRNRFPRAIGRLVRWSCVASPGSICTARATTSAIRDRVSIVAGGTLTYRADAFIRRYAHGTIRNSADVRPPEGVTDPNERNNVALDTTIIDRP